MHTQPYKLGQAFFIIKSTAVFILCWLLFECGVQKEVRLILCGIEYMRNMDYGVKC